MIKSTEIKKAPSPPNGGWGIAIETDNKEPKWVTNFYVKVDSMIDIFSSPQTEPTPHLKLKLCFRDGKYSKEFIEPLSKLDKINWVDKDIRCIIHPDITPATAQRYIANHVREKLPRTSQKQYRLKDVGMHFVEKEPVYYAGSEVIRPPHKEGSDRPVIEPGSVRYSLDFNPNLTEEEAVADMFELMSLFPDFSRPVMAYNLAYFMRELYAHAWEPPRFCIYTYGLSDSRKTTLSELLCRLYNRSKGRQSLPRLDTSIAQSVRIIYSASNCVHVFDDLCPSDSNDVVRYQEKTFSQIVRIIGDGIEPGRVDIKGLDEEKPPPSAGVILTGEKYSIRTPSTAARMLPIEVAPPSDETLGRLVEFQKVKRLSVSTFYRNFIQWIIANYTWAQDFLSKWWDAYSNFSFAAQYGVELHGRLKETHYYMNTSYIMFLEYCSEKGFISEGETEKLRQSFLELITKLVLDQQAWYDQCNINKLDIQIDYLTYFRKLHMDKTLSLAPSVKEFDEEIHDGIIHLGCLCIHGERFREIIEAANANPDEVLDDLQAQGALRFQSGKKRKKTIQVYIKENKKKRFYAIKLTHLK